MKGEFRQTIRMRFSKRGDARFASHRDVMRLFERAFRRADVPVRMSCGFNPRPRIAFPLALGVGMEGLDEVLEVELDRWMPMAEVVKRLKAQLPSGIRIESCVLLGPGQTGQVVRIVYEVRGLASRLPSAERIAALLRQASVVVTRSREGAEKSVNIRPYMADIAVEDDRLRLALHVTSSGTTRPEEVLAAFGVQPDENEAPVELVRVKVYLN